ncbi:MAG: AI-2E family transporter [Bacteroidales bacterium]|nr:AI-2E family transporter [Bacteroidales bacterium]MDD4602654.1 AI-2E family transporter [Bacteroidales bacterium]
MRELYQKNRLFFLIIITAAVGFLVWYFLNIVIFIIVAGVISIIGIPLVDLLDKIKIGKLKFPHVLSVIITLLAIILVIFGLFSLFIPLVVNEAQQISTIDFNKLGAYFHDDIAKIEWTLRHYGVMPRGATFQSLAKQSLMKIVDLNLFSNILTSVISFTGTFFVAIFSIVFLAFFFLLDFKMLPRFILLLTPEKYAQQMKSVMMKSKTLLSRYFIGLICQIMANIITYSLALYIVGVKSPLVIGFFTGIIIIIPYIGGIISMIFGVLLGVTGVISTGEYALILPMAIKILIAMAIVQTIDNNVFSPIIQGKSVKAHPVEIFLVVIAAASFAGILGMVVAVPVYGFIKIVATEFLSNFRLVQRFSEKQN